KTELSRQTLNQVLLDGFFPKVDPSAQPERGRRTGLTEIGLPYAADPAITRHLARFLGPQAGSLHADAAQLKPSAVLLNGGVFQAWSRRPALTIRSAASAIAGSPRSCKSWLRWRPPWAPRTARRGKRSRSASTLRSAKTGRWTSGARGRECRDAGSWSTTCG